MNEYPIRTYIINLKTRPERKRSTLKEFENKPEFAVNVIDAIQHEVGLIGLWQTMKHILKNLISGEEDYILICQDDHQFTENYSFEILEKRIEEVRDLNADILLGGVSWFQSAFFSTKNLFWTEKFSGLQFAIIFKKFFKPLLDLELDDFDAGDYRISAFTDKKWVIWPYISTQRDYGYSDVTLKNNRPERQQTLFKQSEEAVKTLLDVTSFVEKNFISEINDSIDFETVTIPTFIINLPERRDRLAHILKQFKNRNEFDITVVQAIKDPDNNLSLWKTIRKIIAIASENDEDAVVICENTHVFTQHYSRDSFITAILQAHQLGSDLLIGGPSGGVGHIVPVTQNLCWVSAFSGSQFIIIYKKLFDSILNEPFDETVIPDRALSDIAVNKLVYVPFISAQKLNGAHSLNSQTKKHRPIDSIVKEPGKRFERVQSNFLLYNKYKR